MLTAADNRGGDEDGGREWVRRRRDGNGRELGDTAGLRPLNQGVSGPLVNAEGRVHIEQTGVALCYLRRERGDSG
jgi:hypothetical protein